MRGRSEARENGAWERRHWNKEGWSAWPGLGEKLEINKREG